MFVLMLLNQLCSYLSCSNVLNNNTSITQDNYYLILHSFLQHSFLQQLSNPSSHSLHFSNHIFSTRTVTPVRGGVGGGKTHTNLQKESYVYSKRKLRVFEKKVLNMSKMESSVVNYTLRPLYYR